MTLHQIPWKCKSGNTWNKDAVVKDDLVRCIGLLEGLLLHWLDNGRSPFIHISKRHQEVHSAVGLASPDVAGVFLTGFILVSQNCLVYGRSKINHDWVDSISTKWFALLLL